MIWLFGLLAALAPEDPAAGKEPGSAVTFESEVAPKVIRTEKGNSVRVVGIAVRGYREVENTPQGRAVVLDEEEVSIDRVECNVVIQATAKPDGVPGTPELEAFFGGSSVPVLVPGSCSFGTYRWAWLTRGAACVAAADSPYFVASTINELLALPLAERVFLLVVEGVCDDGEGSYQCLVPVEHPDAVAGGTIQFAGTAWLGRPWLNFMRAPAGVPEPRYGVPDGGFAAEPLP